MRDANSRMARMASSLPGIGKSISSGSQFVSTIAMTGSVLAVAAVVVIVLLFARRWSDAAFLVVALAVEGGSTCAEVDPRLLFVDDVPEPGTNRREEAPA